MGRAGGPNGCRGQVDSVREGPGAGEGATAACRWLEKTF